MATVGSRKATGVIPPLILFALLFASLVVMSDATQNSARFGELYSWLLLLNVAGLLVLTCLIGYQIIRMVAQYRARVAGAHLTLRLMVVFVVLAVVPVSVVYYFSLQFLQRGIDSWFDVRIEQALLDALDLSRASLDLRMRETLRQTEQMASQLTDVSEGMAAITLSELRTRSYADDLTLLASSGRVIASASGYASILPDRPGDLILQQVRRGGSFVGLSPGKYSGLQIRAVVGMPRSGPLSEGRVFQALYPVTERFNSLAESVQDAYDSYRQLAFLRGPLKSSFILTLSMVLLVSLLIAVWAAAHSARRLVAPVRDLAEGTLAVSRGRYDQRLPVATNDELGFLVKSFNQMTRNLAHARDQATRSQRLLERQRTYLETVLASLSSGVLTLRHDGRLRTANAAAGQILGVVRDELLDRAPMDIAATRPNLAPFCEIIEAQRRSVAAEWNEEITLSLGARGRQVLMCRGSVLADDRGQRGAVVVFDDITALVKAQRNAAWAEVARRLAHEIKNPLTPIQLAAERIRHKYLRDMDDVVGRVLDRSTHTIVQQVKALRDLVDAFNEYARPPQLRLVRVDLDNLISEVLYLYRESHPSVCIHFAADDASSIVEADPGRLRQLLHNLIKNAVEACSENEGGNLYVTSRQFVQSGHRYVELSFQDDGPGFPLEPGTDIFEPYVTTKAKGTGLGLAIVKKIVEEHGGTIQAETPLEGGARIMIWLPQWEAGRDTALLTQPE